MQQIFVSGTWKAEKAAAYRGEALLLGRQLAEAGVDLACGPGTGIARHVIDGYRQVAPRGTVRYYLPLRSEMEAVGEPIEPGADEILETEYDYPMRNVWQVRQSDGLFVLTGGDGTLEEILPAVIDYHIPVAVVEGAGSASLAMQRLLETFPEWAEFVTLGPDVTTLIGPFLGAVSARAARTAVP